MSKKFFTLFVLFFISIAALIYIHLPSANPQNIINPENLQANESKSNLSANLSFMPNMLSTTSTESAALDIILQTQANPEIVQLEIAYDPAFLYDVDIIPGNYFPDPKVALKKIDVKNGRISYALEGVHTPADYTLAVVAKLSFNSYNVLSEQITPISFLPKTAIKTSGNQILKTENQNLQIAVKPQFYFQIASQSATH